MSCFFGQLFVHYHNYIVSHTFLVYHVIHIIDLFLGKVFNNYDFSFVCHTCSYSHNLPKAGCTKLDTNQIGPMFSTSSIDRKTVQFDVLNQGHQARVIFIEYLK